MAHNDLEHGVIFYFYRCEHPAQQQGRRIPPLIFEIAFLIRIFLVSAFLPDVTQQIHSFRASGVMSSHSVFTAGTEVIALRKSAGKVCCIELFYQIFGKTEDVVQKYFFDIINACKK